MTRRVCLVAVANDFLPTVLQRMPAGVVCTARQELFDRGITTIRLEGPGLPEWCNEPANGAAFALAATLFGGDGIMRFAPVDPATPKTFYERIQEQHGKPN